MGWIEDSIEEFRKLPPAGKVAVGGAAVGVAILAYAQYRSGSTAGSTSGSTTANQGTSDPTGASALTGVGVPSLASSPADWQNWFSSGLSVPQTSFSASDGAPSSSSPVATFTAPVFSAPDFVNTATAHVASSVAAPPAPPAPTPAPTPAPGPGYPIQNPLKASQLAHRGTTTYTPPPPPPTVHTTANTRGIAF